MFIRRRPLQNRPTFPDRTVAIDALGRPSLVPAPRWNAR